MKEVTGRVAGRVGQDSCHPAQHAYRALARGFLFKALSHFTDEEREALKGGMSHTQSEQSQVLSSGLLTPNPVPCPGTADPDWCPGISADVYRLSGGPATAGT